MGSTVPSWVTFSVPGQWSNGRSRKRKERKQVFPNADLLAMTDSLQEFLGLSRSFPSHQLHWRCCLFTCPGTVFCVAAEGQNLQHGKGSNHPLLFFLKSVTICAYKAKLILQLPVDASWRK